MVKGEDMSKISYLTGGTGIVFVTLAILIFDALPMSAVIALIIGSCLVGLAYKEDGCGR